MTPSTSFRSNYYHTKFSEGRSNGDQGVRCVSSSFKKSIVSLYQSDLDRVPVVLFFSYYSMYGHVATLAQEVKAGAESVEGVEASIFQVYLLKP